MSRLSLALRIFLGLIVGVCLILSRMDSIWSGSPDLAHHYALVARIAEHWILPATFDQTLGEMNFYPRYSHIAAALAGSLFGSPLIGLQLVSLIAVLSLWAGFVIILMSLPRYLSLPSALLFVGALCLNKLFLHANLLFHGSEIIDNFFFSQLVAQSLAVLLLAMVLGIERSGWTPVKRNLIMAVCILPMTGVHLLPALEILGVLAGLVVLDFMVIEGAGRRSWKNLLIGILIVIGTVLGVVLNPDFAVMKDIAANNGGLALPYFQKIGRFGGLAAFVMALSCALIFVWWKTEDRDKYDFMPIKYIGLYGASVGLLCILQFVALRFGIGSEYAVKKYAFGIETVLLLEAAVFAALLFRSLSRKWLDSRKFADSPGGFLLILLLTSGCYYCALPYNSANAFDTSDLVSLERQIRSIRDTVLPNLPNKSDIVLDMPGFPTSVNYMLSIGLLKTPRDLAARIIMTPQPSDLAKIGSIVAAEGSPYNIPECRRLLLRSSLVLLDGGCVADRKVR